MPRLFDPSKWVSRGSLIFSAPSRSTPPKLFSGSFAAPAIKIATRVIATKDRSVPASWKWAGNLYAASPKGEEWAAQSVRINTTQIIDWQGLELEAYRLSFGPHHWLPNCRLTIWEYRGDLLTPCASAAQALGVGTGSAGPYPGLTVFDPASPGDYVEDDPNYDG